MGIRARCYSDVCRPGQPRLRSMRAYVGNVALLCAPCLDAIGPQPLLPCRQRFAPRGTTWWHIAESTRVTLAILLLWAQIYAEVASVIISRSYSRRPFVWHFNVPIEWRLQPLAKRVHCSERKDRGTLIRRKGQLTSVRVFSPGKVPIGLRGREQYLCRRCGVRDLLWRWRFPVVVRRRPRRVPHGGLVDISFHFKGVVAECAVLDAEGSGCVHHPSQPARLPDLVRVGVLKRAVGDIERRRRVICRDDDAIYFLRADHRRPCQFSRSEWWQLYLRDAQYDSPILRYLQFCRCRTCKSIVRRTEEFCRPLIVHEHPCVR